MLFQLSDFTTLGAEDFNTVYWVDMVTPPGGDVIDVAREFYEDHRGERLGVRYVPRWGQLDDYLLSSEGQQVAAMKLGEVLVEAAEHDESLREVTAMTSFTVEAWFQDRTRIYRALYLWCDKSPEKAPNLEFHVLGHIVQGVSESYGDPLEAAKSKDEIDAQRSAAASRYMQKQAIQYKIFPACQDDDFGGRTTHKWLFGTGGHINGAHGPYMSTRFDCPCQPNCTQECNPNPYFTDCQEAGDTNQCHRLSSPGFNVSFGFAQVGQPPAGCKSAIACSWKSCFACLCGTPTAGVGVSGRGLSASFSYSWSSASTPIAFEVSHSCRECELEPDSSPVLFDLDQGGFRLTGLDDSVSFDVNDDDSFEQVAWTASGSGDAFLVLDRNGNGTIDNSREMFGNYTVQPASEEPNGYAALAVYDLAENGGDDDGWITAADAVFSKLQLWVDTNHDGTSQESEMGSLADHGVEAIDLTYRESRRHDRHGNLFRYAGLVKMMDNRTIQSVDVFLVTQR